MSSKMKVHIKDFLGRGSSLGLPITSALITHKMVGSTRVPQLTVTRQPDLYSSRFGVLANLRRMKQKLPDVEFPLVTVTQETFADDGRLLSVTDIDFFHVVVDNTRPAGTEEEVVFLADRKSGEFTISNVEVFFD